MCRDCLGRISSRKSNKNEKMMSVTKIEAVDFFYLSMPEVRCIGDGSQDVLLVRLQAGDHVGWGECEASPLVSIAAWNCPMSHSACQPVSASVLGQRLESVSDIERIHREVRENSLDLLQADHTLSGIDIAMWDLLGRRFEEPVHALLGDRRAHAKVAYGSALFGDTPQATLEKARALQKKGFRAVKFGWGPYGRGRAEVDAEHVRAAREGLGNEADLLVDAGTVWESDVEAATARLPALQDCRVRWLEEPFISQAFAAYRSLRDRSGPVALAGGEGCHQALQAINMMAHAGLGYIQIDTGRIGGITAAKQVAEQAENVGVTYVNHTFTTSLALSASMQPFVGLEGHDLCEYPVEASRLAVALTDVPMRPDGDGMLRLPDGPGLGLGPDLETVKRYLVETEMQVAGQVVYRTPEVTGP